MNRWEIPLSALAASRRQMMSGAVALSVASVLPSEAWAAADDGIHSAEAIHQEPVFRASRSQVYEALMDAKKFDAVSRLNGAMRSMATGSKPAEISGEAGGAFTLFGGYVTGRHIELVPNERIVQAWRSQSWRSGEYSIAKFDLIEEATGTKIIFDHRGFPDGTAQHLAEGWKSNYWEPLEQYLAQK